MLKIFDVETAKQISDIEMKSSHYRAIMQEYLSQVDMGATRTVGGPLCVGNYVF